MSTTDDLAIRLRDIRHSANLSQRGLAAELKISPTAVFDYEHGRKLAPKEIIRAWCWACYCDDQTSELLNMWLARLPEVEEYV